MIDEDELNADVLELLGELVADESLELATRYGAKAIATDLVDQLEQDPNIDFEEWLLDREEVVELYADADTLKARIRPILTRIQKGDVPPKWNEALAAAIIANPDDVNARHVFGDWLEEEGDPRGELVALHAAIEEKIKARGGANLDEEDPLGRRERSLLERFRTHLFGDLTRDQKVTFRYGYFDTAIVDGVHIDQLLALHSSRFLRRLDIPYGIVQAVENLEKVGKLPPTLARVRFGEAGGAFDIGLLKVPQAILDLPHLERLDATCENVAFESLSSPSLRELVIFARESVQIANMSIHLPNLTELTIAWDVGITDEEEASVLAFVGQVFADPPKHLRTLRLPRVANGDMLAKIMSSRLLGQLKVLDLRQSLITVDDASVILKNAREFAHLDVLDLRAIAAISEVAWAAFSENPGLRKICASVLLNYEGMGGVSTRDFGNDPDYAPEYDDEDEEEEEDGYEEEEDEDDDAWDDDDDSDGEDPETEDDDEVEEDVEEERQEPAAVDKDAPVEERDVIERYDEPVE